MKKFFDNETKLKIEGNNNDLIDASKSNIINDTSLSSINLGNSASFINQASNIINNIHKNNSSNSYEEENSSKSKKKNDKNITKTQTNSNSHSSNNKIKNNKINNKKKIKKRKKSDSSSSLSSSNSSCSNSSSNSNSSSSSEETYKYKNKKKSSYKKQTKSEEKEEDTKNLKIFKKIIEDTLPNEPLISKNKDGKFLMEQINKDNKKNGNESLEKIIDNFPKSHSIINDYIEEISKEDKKEFFKKNGFVLTQKSKERLSALIHYIITGNPILFEGNTGNNKWKQIGLPKFIFG